MSPYDQLTEQLGLAVSEIIKIRAALATVKAERDTAFRRGFEACELGEPVSPNRLIESGKALATERAAHEETKRELEEAKSKAAGYETLANDLGSVADLRLQAHESTRAEHAKCRDELNTLHRFNARIISEHQADITAARAQERAALAKAEAQLATEQDAGRQYRERISAEESALDRERDLTQKLGARLERLQTASALACRAWEHTPNYSVHEIRGVMRELRALLSPGSGTGEKPYRATCRLCAAALNRDTGSSLKPSDCPGCGTGVGK